MRGFAASAVRLLFFDINTGNLKMSFTDETVNAVWRKGKSVGKNDPNVWRHDKCTAWMRRSAYGDRKSQYGWEIDHINSNGSDVLSNLQPLQWENNVDKSDGRLKCNVKSDGKDNK